MAQSKNNKNEKGVAFEKRAKMDKAQQEILLICCIASAIIGFTLVGSIFLIRKISYNAKLCACAIQKKLMALLLGVIFITLRKMNSSL